MDLLVENSQIYLMLLARIFALLAVVPLLSSSAVPVIARIGIAFFSAYVALPAAVKLDYYIPETVLEYALCLGGEVIIGLTIGFVVQLFFTVFMLAGQFFSTQMGFAASQVFDPLGQQQIPVLGQLINLFAMLLFVTSGGIVKVFYTGVVKSFRVLSPYGVAFSSEPLHKLFVTSMGKVFAQAFIIALPVMGTLFLASLTLGLLAKAAPQMNLLMMGFPINISVGFLILVLILPVLANFIIKFLDQIYYVMEDVIGYLSG